MKDDLPLITPSCQVSIHYSLTLEDGTVAVSTFDDDPLTFTLGDGTMVETLEQALLGLNRNSDTHILISGDEVFGASNSDKIQCMHNTDFPSEMELAVGQVIAFTTPAGDEIPGQILNIDGEEILVDFNHPLAGHMIDFRVKVLDISHLTDPSVADNRNL